MSADFCLQSSSQKVSDGQNFLTPALTVNMVCMRVTTPCISLCYSTLINQKVQRLKFKVQKTSIYFFHSRYFCCDDDWSIQSKRWLPMSKLVSENSHFRYPI